MHSDADAVFDKTIVLNAAEIKPQVTWGTSPEMVVSIDGNVPDPSQESDLVKRNGMEKALAYMGLKANQAIKDIQLDRVLLVHAPIRVLRTYAKLLQPLTVVKLQAQSNKQWLYLVQA